MGFDIPHMSYTCDDGRSHVGIIAQLPHGAIMDCTLPMTAAASVVPVYCCTMGGLVSVPVGGPLNAAAGTMAAPTAPEGVATAEAVVHAAVASSDDAGAIPDEDPQRLHSDPACQMDIDVIEDTEDVPPEEEEPADAEEAPAGPEEAPAAAPIGQGRIQTLEAPRVPDGFSDADPEFRWRSKRPALGSALTCWPSGLRGLVIYLQITIISIAYDLFAHGHHCFSSADPKPRVVQELKLSSDTWKRHELRTARGGMSGMKIGLSPSQKKTKAQLLQKQLASAKIATATRWICLSLQRVTVHFSASCFASL